MVFFDTSALIRRYDRGEPSSDHVRNLCRRENGHTLLIAQLTSVEFASALNRKVRERSLTRVDCDRLWRLFRLHRRDQYQVLAIDNETTMMAEALLFSHRLRAYDAIQLASAIRTSRLLGDLAPDFRFCTADQAQAEAASAEGLAVELIA